MKNNRLLQLGLLAVLCALIGFLLPQQFLRVQKIQSLFIQADEQLNYFPDCSATALGAVPAALDNAPEKCQAIARARAVYDGLSYPEAREALDRDLFRDQTVFATITAGLGLLCYLTLHLLSSLIATRRRSHRSVQTARQELGLE